MIRYEANTNGQIEIGEPFTDFNEFSELEEIFSQIGWGFERLRIGRGGYCCYNIAFPNNQAAKIHIYLKKITFGGRENRPYEKRAQFAAGLDRTGFDEAKHETVGEFALILGLYKSNSSSETIVCAWSVHDWGYNIGRAFNCFIDIQAIADAYKDGIAQYKTSIGQIACCFQPSKFPYYVNNKTRLHERIESNVESLSEDSRNDNIQIDDIPKYYDLFQLVIDILRDHDGRMNIDIMEIEAIDRLNLSNNACLKIHNPKEGYRTELGYQLAWARHYLKRAGIVYNPTRSIWVFTELGWNADVIIKEDVIRTATEKEIGEEIKADASDYDTEGGIEVETDESTGKILNPFDPNLVDIRTRTMSLDLILKRLRKDEIDMATGFQRKANLWNNEKQSRLIESILVKFPLPAFYFDGSNDDKWLVVDGLQRLSSLDNYVNKQLFGLQGLEFLTQFEGIKFNQLPGYLQRRIEEFEITAYVIAAGTPKILKYNVFKRINTGGLVLTLQEIRNALNQGVPSRFVRKLSALKSFKLSTSYSIPEDRMLDQEFVTRFLAFYLLDIDKEYTSDLDAFLNMAMDSLNNIHCRNLVLIKQDFDKATKAALAIFGDDAFRKRYSKEDRRKPINKALFDAWTVNLAKLTDSEIAILVSRKEVLIDKFIEILNTDDDFNKAITSSTGDKSRIKKRFSEIDNIIRSINCRIK